MEKLKVTIESVMTLKENQFNSICLESFYNNQKFELVLITRECIENKEIVSLLSRWRKENEFWFQAIFPISDSRTKIWLQNKVIDERDRLLFMIRINGEFIGHVGLWKFDFEKNACEIDNIIRGEKENPGIIYDAIVLLQDWARMHLNIKDFYLHTLLENERAMKLYKKLGYKVIKTEPLIKVNIDERLEWISPPEDYTGEIGRHEVLMILMNKN